MSSKDDNVGFMGAVTVLLDAVAWGGIVVVVAAAGFLLRSMILPGPESEAALTAFVVSCWRVVRFRCWPWSTAARPVRVTVFRGSEKWVLLIFRRLAFAEDDLLILTRKMGTSHVFREHVVWDGSRLLVDEGLRLWFRPSTESRCGQDRCEKAFPDGRLAAAVG